MFYMLEVRYLIKWFIKLFNQDVQPEGNTYMNKHITLN